MKRLGYAVDEKVYRMGRQSAVNLFRQVSRQADERGTNPPPQNEQGQAMDPASDAAFILMCLAATGEPIAGMLDSSADKVLKGHWPGAHVLAMLAVAAAETHHPKGKELADRLEQVAMSKGGLCHWEGTKENWHGYAGGDLLPTINAVKALCLLKPQSSLIAKAEAFLASEHQGYGWFSTWSTSQAVSLLPYLSKIRKFNWEGGVDISASIQGGPSWTFKSIDKPGFRRWNTKEPRQGFFSMAEPKPVTVNVSGRGLLVWTYAYQVSGNAQAPLKGETFAALRMDLSRQLWKLKTPQQTGNAQKGWIRAPWTGTLRQGDEAWMELKIHCERYADYLVLEVPIPAGLEPTVKLEGFVLEGEAFTEEDSADGGGYYYKKPRIEVHADKVVVFYQQVWPWWDPTVRILLRAGMAGQYKMRPAKLSLMSNETLWTTCDGLELSITEGGKR